MAADPLAAAAALPFQLTEALALPVALERSLKFGSEGPLGERYVLALASDELGPERWAQLVAAMGTPRAQHPLLLEAFAGSTTVALGYERTRRGASLRLYLEHWQPLLEALERLTPVQQQQLSAGAGVDPWPLILGVKWSVLNPEEAVVTRYGIDPLLAAPLALGRFRRRLEQLFAGQPFLAALDPTLEGALTARPDQPVRLLHVAEDGGSSAPNQRDSLDLDVADLALPWSSLTPVLQALTQAFPGPDLVAAAGQPGQPLSLPGPVIGPGAQLTHLQTGLDRSGRPFFTLYHRG